jgi:hypothetical protein
MMSSPKRVKVSDDKHIDTPAVTLVIATSREEWGDVPPTYIVHHEDNALAETFFYWIRHLDPFHQYKVFGAFSDRVEDGSFSKENILQDLISANIPDIKYNDEEEVKRFLKEIETLKTLDVGHWKEAVLEQGNLFAMPTPLPTCHFRLVYIHGCK